MNYSIVFAAHVGTAAQATTFLREEADAAHTQYRQYRGHWDGWVLGRLLRTVKTKAGVAGRKGDLVLFNPTPDASLTDVLNGNGKTYTVFYSRATQCNTVVDVDSVRAVT